MALADEIIEAAGTPLHLKLTKDIEGSDDEIPEGTVVRVIKDYGKGKYAVASPDGNKADVQTGEYEEIKK